LRFPGASRVIVSSCDRESRSCRAICGRRRGATVGARSCCSADLRRPDEEGLAERSQAFAAAARTIRAPALFLLQWDDELFPRQDGLALYDLLGSREKTLHANPGGHVALPRAEVADIIQFVRRHLAGTGLTAKGDGPSVASGRRIVLTGRGARKSLSAGSC
jgi:hypothetical protein